MHFKELRQCDKDSESPRPNFKETMLLSIAFEIGNGDMSKLGKAIKIWGDAPDYIRNDADVKKITYLFSAVSHCNFEKFYQIYESLPLLVRMCLHGTLNWMRFKFVRQAKAIHFEDEYSRRAELQNLL